MLSYFKKLKIDYFLLFLILIAVFLFFNNYTPGTFLSGWDTLHPEFNFKLYFQRAFSFWQDHQGLGAPASQAHVADIPRAFLLWIFSWVIPLEFVRYSYFLLTIILGPVGIYLLIKYIFILESSDKNELLINASAFLGALFYLLNIGTMQHFIVPFEMFAMKFALLGFIYLFTIKYLISGKRKNLIIFALLALFSSSMGHTGTLWYVYYLGLLLFIGTFYLLKRQSIKHLFSRSLILLISTLSINSFWIIPNMYYGINYGVDVIGSKINRLFTSEAFYFNKKYGNISDLLLFRNFLFDWSIFNNAKESKALLSDWIIHLSNPLISFLGYAFSTLSLAGILVAIKKRKNILVALLPIAAISIFFLLSNTPVLSQIFDFLRSSNKLLAELLRFPFTKFSINLIFVLSIFFAYMNKYVLKKLLQIFLKIKDYTVISVYFYTLIILILIYSAPAFRGGFISPIVRVNIPNQYFELFDWFDSKENGRVLTLPMHTVFGWNYYVWEEGDNSQVYQGAGFNWFGIKQPTLNREFDRWYPYNEQSYRELSYALYSNNANLFQSLLDKYNIKYILLDENIKNLDGSSPEELYIPQSSKLLSSLDSLTKVKDFDNLYVYEYENANNFSTSKMLEAVQISPNYSSSHFDQAYLDNSTYISSNDQKNEIIYPARNILNRNERVNKNILDVGNNLYKLILDRNIPKNSAVALPSLIDSEDVLKASLYLITDKNGRSLLIEYLIPTSSTPITEIMRSGSIDNFNALAINNKLLSFPSLITTNKTYLGEISLYTKNQNNLRLFNNNSLNILPLKDFNLNPYLCDGANNNQLFGSNIIENGFEILAQNASVCIDLPLTNLVQVQNIPKNTALINFKYKVPFNSRGEFCFYDNILKSCLNKKILLPSIHKSTSHQDIYPGESNISNLSLRFLFNAKTLSKSSTLSITNLNIGYPTQSVVGNFSTNSDNFSESIKDNLQLEGIFPEDKINIIARQVNSEKKDCAITQSRFIDKKIIKDISGDMLEYRAIEGTICESFSFSDIDERSSYILGIESQNLSGLPLKVCLEEDSTKKCVLEEELSAFKNIDTDYFIIPKYNHSGGYHLILRNISIGDTESVNRLKSIKIIPFPYSYIQGIKILNSESLQKNRIIKFDNAYEKNWSAYVKGKRLKNHVLVDNWANGWIIDEDTDVKNVKFVFWPQYLEYFGFLLLVITFSWILFNGRFKRSS
ncbi:MAG: hypothetical protein WEC80_00965 [Patescibacteria group bacterium]